MFEVQSSRAFVSSYNPRAEKHGDENKPAGDLRIEVTGLNTILEQFDNGLTSALFREVRKGDETRGEMEQIDIISALPSVRYPLLQGLKWDDEYTGYKLVIESESGMLDPIEFCDVTLKKFAFEPIEGGSVRITFNAIVHPEKDQSGELCALIQEHVNLTLIAPQAAEQKKAA